MLSGRVKVPLEAVFMFINQLFAGEITFTVEQAGTKLADTVTSSEALSSQVDCSDTLILL